MHPLLSQLTLAEKIGQMTQVTADLLYEGKPMILTKPRRLSMEKLRRAVNHYKVGSILNRPQTGPILSQQDWQEVMRLLRNAIRCNRVPIPVLYGIDSIHGANYVKGATLFPQPLAQAASFNPGLTQRLAEVTAYEMRSASLPWNFSPALDVPRQPVWPRTYESFGEDVYLNSVFGVATVRGYQGDNPGASDRVAACLKHFTGYGQPFSGRDRSPVYIGEAQLRELFLPAFQAAIDAGALTLMVNSGEINGRPVHADPVLLTKILREEMGFEGLVVTDWEDIHKLHEFHHVAKDLKEATRLAIEAGIDMSMTAITFDFHDLLLELVEEGTIPESRIDTSVQRILDLKERLGLFENTVNDPRDYPHFGSIHYQALSLQAAEESVVLLKNENHTLPIPGGSRLLVTGPTAHSQRSLNGGWTCDWQGDTADVELAHHPTILEGLRGVFGEQRVAYFPGVVDGLLAELEAVVAAARLSDYLVVCLGEFSYTEFEGDIDDLRLPQAQYALVHALATTNKPIILVMAQGRPRIIEPIEPHADAVLAAFYPGPQGGRALAHILSGKTNPSGKLPITYPRFTNALLTYDHKYSEGPRRSTPGSTFYPQFEFGHGLSYSSIEYTNLRLVQRELTNGDSLEITISVRNPSGRTAQEAVLVFVSQLYGSLTPPVRRLRAFRKVQLEPWSTRALRFVLPLQELATIQADGSRDVQPGAYEIQIGELEAAFSIASK